MLAVAAAVGTGAVGSASAAEKAVVPCEKGYVCLVPLYGTGWPVLVPEGKSADFDPALRISEITNNTSITYCVGGDLHYPLGSGQTRTGVQQVTGLDPSYGGACLL
ncbi:hypothetical protein [Streptomyces sp. NPDC002845]